MFYLLYLSSFLTTSFFTAWLSLLKRTRTGTNLSKSYLSTLLFNQFGTYSNLSICKLSTSDFKLAKSTFLANFDVLTPVVRFLNLLLFHS